MKRSWPWALLGGLAGAAAIVGFLAYKKNRELRFRGAAISSALQSDGDRYSAYLLTKGSNIEADLAEIASTAAEHSAARHLSQRYGMTPELVGRLQRASRILS